MWYDNQGLNHIIDSIWTSSLAPGAPNVLGGGDSGTATKLSQELLWHAVMVFRDCVMVSLLLWEGAFMLVPSLPTE